MRFLVYNIVCNLVYYDIIFIKDSNKDKSEEEDKIDSQEDFLDESDSDSESDNDERYLEEIDTKIKELNEKRQTVSVKQ